MNNIKIKKKLIKLLDVRSEFFNNIKIKFVILALIFFVQSCQTKNQDFKASLVNPINNFVITKKKCSGSDVTFWNNCLGTFYYDNGNKYIGEYKNGKINGQGKFFYKSGSIYDGNNKDGLAHGFGSLTFKNGDKYEGNFLKDKYHGNGKFFFVSGNIFEGNFKNGKRFGKGKYIYLSGELFEGEYKNNERHGKGKLIYKSGNTYEGDFKNGNITGYGVMNFANGEKYVGSVKDNKKHGNGKYIYNSGDIFEGNYNKGIKEGYGIYKFVEGDKYEGEYKLDLREGYGVFNFKNGNKFIGNFKNGKRHGKGKFFYKDGSNYIGDYQNGLRHGKGIATYVSGSKYIGEYLKGKANGIGKYIFTNGNFYEGMFKDNEYSGEGKFIYSNGKINEGIWKNNKLIERKKIDKFFTNKPKPLESQKSKKLFKVGSGSGFAVSKEGYFLTNNHVIHGCQNIKIHANNNIYQSTMIARDVKNDLALLKADFKPSFVFPISSKPANLMDEVFVAGFPFGHRISSNIKITKGIVSSLAGLGDDYTRFQLDAAVQPGNSGGPIYDKLGNVVGITVAKLDYKFSLKNYSSIPELTNFGIKSSMVRSFLSASNIKFRNEVYKKIENLGQSIQNGSYYISCFMSKAQYKILKNEKVLFKEENIFNSQ